MKPQQVPVSDRDDIKPPHSQSDLHDDDHHDPHLREFSSNQMRAISMQGYLTVLGGVLLHLVLGTFYLWGGISPYIAAYLRQYDASVTQTTMGLVFPFLGIITNSCTSFGIKLAERFGFKIIIFLAGCSISLAFLICSFITNFWGFVAIYCIMIGVPSGLVYMLPIVCGWKFFPQHRGRVSGLTIAGYGFGSFIFNFVCQALVNPNNLTPTIKSVEDGHVKKYFGPAVYDKVPAMLQMLAGSYLALSIIATLLIKYPRDLNLEQQVVLSEKQKSGNDKQQVVVSAPINECETLLQGIKSVPFLFLCPMIFLSIIFGMLMANSYKTYGLQLGFTDTQNTLAGSLSSVSNGCSRLAWASAMDKFGFKPIFIIVAVMNLVLTATMGSVQGNIAGYIVILCFTMCCEGGMLSCFPAQAHKMFGHKVGPIIYGLLFFLVGISNMAGYLLMRYTQPNIGWSGLFWICFGLNALSLLFGIFFKDSHNWEKN